MAFGKKKTRGPISKAYFRGGDISKALEEVKNHYIAGVQSESAKNAWGSGVMGFLGYFVPKVDDVVKDLRARIKDPYARMEQVLKAESKIAAEYDRIKRDQMLENEKKAF
ncbi:MAG: hypothetical protein OWQ50_02775, partial [Acidianus infernus]|nr:hypothetical protein [Acidianus infernus]